MVYPRFRRLGVAILPLVLAACASLQDPARTPAPGAAVPTAWSAPRPAAAAPASLAGWWSRFGDATLSRLVQDALAGSTDVQAATARLRQARAARDLAAAALAPALTAGASAQRSHNEGQPGTRLLAAALDASWEPDLRGATGAAVDAAGADLAAQQAALGSTQVSVAAETAAAYLELRGTQARLTIAEANLASQRQTLQIAEWRAQAGLVTTLDVQQARTSVEQTRAQLPALQTAIAQSMNALAVLTGAAPGSLAATLGQAAPLPAVPPGLALALPAEVLRQRPDVQAAEAQLRAAAARVQAADAERLPSLSLGGSIGLSALTLSGLGSGAGVASLAAAVNLPLLDGGRLQAQVRGQEAAADVAAAAYRATVLAALQEVEDTLVALAGSRRQQASLRQAEAAAHQATQLAEAQYRSGLIDFATVLQTQRTLLSLQDGLSTTATTIATQHVRLYKALGGGWTPDNETATS